MASETVTGPVRAAETGSCRRFGLSDAMILTAGAAPRLPASTHLIVLLADSLGRPGGAFLAHWAELPARLSVFWVATHDLLRNTLWYGFQVAMGLLIGVTPAFFIVRLRRPRPPLRALIRPPGAVAGPAMVLGLFWGTGALVTLFPDRFDGINAAPSAIGAAVALAWGVLALSRKWQPERGWRIDRVGRLLGSAAIGLAMLGHLLFWI